MGSSKVGWQSQVGIMLDILNAYLPAVGGENYNKQYEIFEPQAD